MNGQSDVHSLKWQDWSGIDCRRTSVHDGSAEIAFLLDEVLRDWPESRVFTADSVLNAFPVLQANRSAVVAIAAEEYLRDRLADRSVDKLSFAARFGNLSDSILRATEVMEFLLRSQRTGDAAAHDEWPIIGEQVAHFELRDVLGGGLLSRVYVACDTAVARRHVVVKLTRNSEREIRALGKLSHESIVPILSIHDDSARGLTAVVMPFHSRVTLQDAIGFISRVDGAGKRDIALTGIGREIHQWNLKEPRPGGSASTAHRPLHDSHSEWVARMGADIAAALHAAHSQGVLHCDVKPSNVVLVDDRTPMLVDFNLCVGDDARRVAVGGTLPYMSPEQLCGDQLDERTDVFSLAATLYHLLLTKPPFGGSGTTISEALASRVSLDAGLRRQDKRLSNVDGRLARVILKGMAHYPPDRFATAALFEQALRECLLPRARAWRSIRRHRRELQGMAIATSLVLAGLGLWASNRSPAYFRAATAAVSAAQRGNQEDSLAYANQALASRSRYAPALILRANVHLQRGEFESAFNDLSVAAETTSDPQLEALLAYAKYRVDQDDWAAIKAMERAQAAGMQSPLLHNNLGYCSEHIREFGAAESNFKHAIELDSNCGVARLNLANLDLRMAIRSKQRPDPQLIEDALTRFESSCDAHYTAVEVYIQNIRYGGEGRDKVMLHGRRALQLGLPRPRLIAALKRLPEPLRSQIAGELPEFDADSRRQSYQRTERFVVPCDASVVASAILRDEVRSPRAPSTTLPAMREKLAGVETSR